MPKIKPVEPAAHWPKRALFAIALGAALVLAFFAGRSTLEPAAEPAPIAAEDSTPPADAPQPAIRETPPPARPQPMPRVMTPRPEARSTPPAPSETPRAIASTGAPDAARSSTAAATALVAEEPVILPLPPGRVPRGLAQSKDANVIGRVTLKGTPPAMAELDPWADPKCQMPAHATDQEVLAAHPPNQPQVGWLANVFVRVVDARLETGAWRRWPTAEDHQLTVRAHECEFVPRVSGLWKSGALTLQNEDNTTDDLTGLFGGQPLFHFILDANSSRPLERPLADANTLGLSVADKPWMRAYVVVNDSPFFAVTDPGGGYWVNQGFSLAPGIYTIEAWHERYGTLRKKAAVRAGQTTRVDFEFSTEAAQAQSANP